MSERAECKRIEGKYWELIKVWPLECRQVQAMVAEEDDDDVVVVGAGWREVPTKYSAIRPPINSTIQFQRMCLS